jgi:hypothetical protein
MKPLVNLFLFLWEELMNILEYSNLHLNVHGTLHMAQVVQLLVHDHLSLRDHHPAHLWEPGMVQVVVHLYQQGLPALLLQSVVEIHGSKRNHRL